jgi:pimeloyl-ACP methyl ester carboxylesterase
MQVAGLAMAAPAIAPPTTLEGHWTGGFIHRGDWVTVDLTLKPGPHGFDGIADLAFTDYEGGRGITLTSTAIEGSRVRFTVPTARGPVAFDGRLTDGTIAGQYRLAEASGEFGMTRVIALNAADRGRLFGAYQLESGHVVSVIDFYGGNLRLVDYRTGQQNTLYPIASDRFISGPGQTVSYPVTLRVQFVMGATGRATELGLRSSDDEERMAQRLPFEEVPVTCANDTLTLGGTLLLPTTPGPHPAIIVTPGDFGSPRDALRGYAYNFVRRGIAAMVFDSRGAGGSSGPVASSSFGDLANDVLAWVALLRQRADIDPKKVGVFGFSNSSWTVILAASRSKDVAFLISQSTSALPPWEQEAFRAERQVRLAGFSDADVLKAREVMRRKFEVARTGEGWERLQETLKGYEGEAWVPYTNPSRSLERLRAYWDRSFSYDPVPALRQVTCPALFIFGSVDSNMPVDASIPLIKEALNGAGNRDYAIRVFPRGRHDLIEGVNGGSREFPRMMRFVPGYWDAMADWVVERFGS